MDADIHKLYHRLCGVYPVELKNSLQIYPNAKVDYPVLCGTSVMGKFEMFFGDLSFEFYAVNENGEFLTHSHFQQGEDAEKTVVDFMNGKLAAVQFGQPNPFADFTTHQMKLHPSPFEQIKRGMKTIELRLYDEKRQQIKVGDQIVFTNNITGETLATTVVKLHCFNSFEELYKTLPLLKCGYAPEDIDQAHPADMEQYYSAEEQSKYGVVGIELTI